MFDSQSRRARDRTDQLTIELTKAQTKAVLVDNNDDVAPFLRRQLTSVMQPKHFPTPRAR